MSLLRWSKGEVGSREDMARRSSSIRKGSLLDVVTCHCTISLYRTQLLSVINAYPQTSYISSGFAGSKYLHWLGGEAVSRPSHLSSAPSSIPNSRMTHPFHSIIFPISICSAFASSKITSAIDPKELSNLATSSPELSTVCNRCFVNASVA